jgi:RNA recognition motif-containing protein
VVNLDFALRPDDGRVSATCEGQGTLVFLRGQGDDQDTKGKKMNIYVGNLSYQTTEESLQQAFEAFGEVASVSIIKDKYSGVSRGFGFVEMPVKSEAIAAINGLNDEELNGRRLNVNEARPRGDRRSGGRRRY